MRALQGAGAARAGAARGVRARRRAAAGPPGAARTRLHGLQADRLRRPRGAVRGARTVASDPPARAGRWERGGGQEERDGGRLRDALQGGTQEGDRWHHHARRSALPHAGGHGLMPSYFYRARDTFGRAHEGVEVAASEDEVLRALSQMRLTPVLIEPRSTNGNGAVATATSPRVTETEAAPLPFWSE